MPRLRLAFMGTPDFSVPILESLVRAGHEVACVYAQPARPAGRGQKPRPSPVEARAHALGLAVRTPTALKGADELERFRALSLDGAVVAAYGLILPKPILEAPRLGAINVHASLLPRWRGAAPIQRAIMAGDPETGVTIMQMDEGLDTGAMLLKKAVPIGPETTGQNLHDRLSALGASLILEALDGLAQGTLAPIPQPASGVTYAKKLARADGRLDWRRPAIELDRVVRALDPWPGAFFECKGERIKVVAAALARERGTPGQVVDDRLTVACGEGALRLLKLQRAGRAAMGAADLLRGYAIPKGTVLG